VVSSTAQTERRRRLKEKRGGRTNKKTRHISPPFPIHPEGYDPKAPDAKKSANG
jgi:hypothetical protein